MVLRVRVCHWLSVRFVSATQAWAYDFLTMAATVISWGRAQRGTVYAWLDVFAVNQHAPEQPAEWWDSTFRLAVGELGHTLLVLTPWNSPLALTRVWCLWEILCTIEQGAQLTVLLPEDEKACLAEALEAGDLGHVQEELAQVDAQRAEARLGADRQRIFEAVQRLLPRGFLDLNDKVKQCLRDWTCRVGRERLQEMSSEQRCLCPLVLKVAEYCRKTSQYELAERLYQEAVDGRRQQRGHNDPDTMDAIAGLGYLLEYQSKCDRAQPLLEEALTRRRAVLGNDHRDTLQSMNDLGNLCMSVGDLQAAKQLYEEALDGRRRTLRQTEYDVLQSINNLGRCYRNLGMLERATPLFEEAVEGRRQTLGDLHPATLHSMTYLAQVYTELGRSARAMALYEPALAGEQSSRPAQLTSPPPPN